MKYRVIVTPEAKAGIRESFEYIHERAPLNAVRWLHGLYRQIETLERNPERCSFAREREWLEEDLRQLYVLHVRHAKRRAINEPAAPRGDV